MAQIARRVCLRAGKANARSRPRPLSPALFLSQPICMAPAGSFALRFRPMLLAIERRLVHLLLCRVASSSTSASCSGWSTSNSRKWPAAPLALASQKHVHKRHRAESQRSPLLLPMRPLSNPEESSRPLALVGLGTVRRCERAKPSNCRPRPGAIIGL